MIKILDEECKDCVALSRRICEGKADGKHCIGYKSSKAYGCKTLEKIRAMLPSNNKSKGEQDE